MCELCRGIVQRGGSSGGKINWTGHDGGTQTQIHPTTGGGGGQREERHRETGSGEVRVIVQPIQPVFYMPRQSTATVCIVPHPHPSFSLAGGATTPQGGTGPAPAIHQQTSGGAPNVVYVPRNVYVPVIKPVFVPRERK